MIYNIPEYGSLSEELINFLLDDIDREFEQRFPQLTYLRFYDEILIPIFHNRHNLPDDDEIQKIFLSCDQKSPTLQYAFKGGKALPFSGGRLKIQKDGECEVDTRIWYT